MKELKLELNDKNKTEISIQKKIQIEKELIGKIIPHGGHRIYEINKKTLEVKVAEYIRHTSFTFNNFSKEQVDNNPEILCHSDYAYVSALNGKNALKQYRKGNNGSKDLSGGIEINPFK